MAKRNLRTTKMTIESIRHQDKRTNIPTEELRDFVAEDELVPKTMRYPRDPSLDPQLIWKGKDEQDRDDLAVPVVPIYIQEKIHPQALIDALPRSHRNTDEQLNFFADFNGGPQEFAQKVDFYRHEQHWTNRMILGDSLLVMTSLAEKEGLKGKVQSIYLDPPYGIKFGSNWQVSTRKKDVKDGKAEDATRQPEQVRAFRDTWKLGIHSYLSYFRDRLVVARELLTETGSIFVQIGDENVHLVRCVLDEVFGSENFVSLITYRTSVGLGAETIDNVGNYLLWYAKQHEFLKYRPLFKELTPGAQGATRYQTIELPNGSTRRLTEDERDNVERIPDGARFFRDQGMTSRTGSATTIFSFEYLGRRYVPKSGGWRTSINGMTKLALAGRLLQTGDTLSYKKFFDDFSWLALTNFWEDVSGGITSRADPKVYVVQTATKIVERCLQMTTDPGDLVLDPTCGSGTTAYVAEQWGRRWITIDTSRVALALARTRLMTAKYPYYLLADSPEGIQREAELTGKILPETKTDGDIRKGFVYKRVPHVTLKSIANNPDIHEGMTREQIHAALTRHADTEILYDQPYEDNKLVRVCGPFSVESLSPHRMLSAADENQERTVTGREVRKQQDFVTMILENLKKAGVQNTRKDERLQFEQLEPYAGTWIHATGEYADADDTSKRGAVSIGPEHGTVGPQQVKEAAKEAVQGIGFDVLVICGFAFDPHVTEEAKRYGKLIVLPTKVNPDLTMGDELLKKTGAGNLFMVFGEPDVDVRKLPDGQLEVEILGVDVYDPTTGQIRSASTDDIACWFIDTDYDGESFFVRHVYFTGANEPYEQLRRALRAEIDEEAWASLYRIVSRPFPKPASSRIAIKVINHYGDEVLKVFELQHGFKP